MEENQPSKLRKTLTSLMLLGFLVVAPAMSWYYLNSGANVYRGYMNQLGEYGSTPAFSFDTHDGKVLDAKDLDKSLVVFQYVKGNGQDSYQSGARYVYDEFSDNKGVRFATLTDKVIDSVTYVQMAKDAKVDRRQWQFLHGDSSEVAAFKSTAFTMPDSLQQIAGELDDALILIDTNNVVRNFYSSTDTAQMNVMITTMSLLMPRPEKAKIKFERETEK